MKNVVSLFGSLSLLIALASCSEEGSIGRERCLGENTRCEPVQPELNFYDTSKAKAVSSDVTREAELIWSVDLECAGLCSTFTQLIDDGAGGLWVLQLPGGLGGLSALGPSSQPEPGLKYKRVDEMGNVVTRGEVPVAKDELFAINPLSRAWPHPEGGILIPRTSSLFDRQEPLPHIHRLTRIGDDGFEDLIVGRSKDVSRVGYSGPQYNFDAMPSDDGFITAMLAPEAQVVRKIDAAGNTIWRQVELPIGSNAVWSVIPLDFGFALLTSSEPFPTGAPTGGLLWFDTDGNVTAQGVLPFSWPYQRSALLGLSGARVAIAGTGGTIIEDAGVANWVVLDLHVMRLGPDGTTTGHRIVSEGLAALTFGSMAADADDTIYVTSVTGTRRSPRGLICALPDQGDGTCYLTPEEVSLQPITAPAPGVLYALSGEALIKLALPPE